jgi:hypothetical protein
MTDSVSITPKESVLDIARSAICSIGSFDRGLQDYYDGRLKAALAEVDRIGAQVLAESKEEVARSANGMTAVLEALKKGPRPEWRESGPERGQDYYQAGETDRDFNSRIVGMLRKAALDAAAERDK